MAEEYRSADYKYSEAEIAEVGEGMRKLKTYLADGGSGSVSSTEMEAVLMLEKKEHRPEQVACYKAYWDNHYDGRIPVDAFADLMRTLHNDEYFVQFLVKGADKNGNGFIEKDEFADTLRVIVLHNAKMCRLEITFEKFVEEADINLDGKVSLQECTTWIQKQQERFGK